MQRIIIFK